MELTIGLAFAAGFISFISPCVLPLVPAYITYMGGRVTNTVAAQVAGGGTKVIPGSNTALITRVSTGVHSVFFVLGFSLVFVGIGLLSTAFIQTVGGSNISAMTQIIGRAGGIVIIAFGLHFMDAISWTFNKVRQRENAINLGTSILIALAGSMLIFWAFDRPVSMFNESANLFDRTIVALPVFTAFAMWLALSGAFTRPKDFWLKTMEQIELALYADTRGAMQNNGGSGYGSSTLMGIVFAAGWTPCIGPIYGAILTLAANGGSVSQAGVMLSAYSLGLGIPFIVTALALDGAQGFLRSLKRHMKTIKLVSGIFLIAIGILIASGRLQQFSAWGSQGELGLISFRMEECFTHAVSGDVPWGQVVPCINGNYEIPTTAGAATLPDSTAIDGAAGSVPAIDGVTDTGAVAPLSIEGAAGDIIEGTIGTNIGDIAPDFVTTLPDGTVTSLADHQGEIVLLNFWATWCGPCRIEMPEFQEAYDEHRENGFTILAVNNQERAEQVTEFGEELNLTFPLLMDERGDIQAQYGVVNYPSTYLIGPDGVILDRHLGPLTADAISEMINSAF
jgi:cytochrome c-type biogenesis protein